ncbi:MULTISPECIES: hypothetical protein [unclassified Streptomyces]|nr:MULTISPECIES: hypothetical protein [unclassified Streptomyces]MBK3567570.1 hypothetical protein [Streptomyces sp. MBT62]MBK6015981.1 hypothetical protein [Streptomyces sp. MBT53]
MTEDVLFLSGDRVAEPHVPHNSAGPGILDAAAARAVTGAAPKERP